MVVIAFTSLKWTTSASRDRSSGLGCSESWFSDLEDTSKDFLPISAFRLWLSSHLTDPPDEPNHVPGYVQVVIAGIMIGDKNAVEALQNAHLRQLLSCGALTVQSLRLLGTLPTRASLFGDVYVDDLAVLAMVETSNRAFAEDQWRMDRVDAMYAALGMSIKKPPGDGDFEGPSWGVHLDGQRDADEPPSPSPLVSEPVWVSTARS